MSNKMLPSGISVRIREDLIDGVSRTQTTLIIDPIITQGGHRVIMDDIGSIGYGKIDGGGPREEIISWTGITDNITTYTLTGCVWGINFHNLEASADNTRRHTSGAKFEIKTDMHYITNQFRDNEDNVFTNTDAMEFNSNEIKLGDGTSTLDKILTADNGDANAPFVKYDETTGKWLISNDGVNSYDPEDGGSGVTAGNAISIVGGEVSVKTAETSGVHITGDEVAIEYQTDPGLSIVDNKLGVKVKSGTGLLKDADGIYCDSIDPDNINPQAAGYLIGGTGHSDLSVFNSLVTSGNAGKFKINVDGTDYDDLEIIPPYNFNNFAYANKSFTLRVSHTNGAGPFFKPDGTKVYYAKWMYGADGGICVRTLSTPWDISTAGEESFQSVSIGGYPAGLWFKPDGTKFYITSYYNSNIIGQWTLATPWDISSAITKGTVKYLSNNNGAGMGGFCMNDDGTVAYIGSHISGIYRNRQWTLSTPSDTSTANDSGIYHSSIFPFWYDSGTKALVANGNNYDIYNASTAWDISTLTASGETITGSYAVGTIFMNAEKTRIFNGLTPCYQHNNGELFSSYSQIATTLQTAIRAATGYTETVIYDTDHFVITSATQNRDSQILKLMSPSTGTDISGAGATPYLDMADNATETQGTGEEYMLVRLDEEGQISVEIMENSLKLTQQNTTANIIIATEANVSTDSTSYIKGKEIVIGQTGSYYIGLTISSTGSVSNAWADAQIYKNGVAIGTARSVNNVEGTFHETLSFNKGDLLQVYYKCRNASYPANLNKVRVYGFLTPPVWEVIT